MGLWHVFVHACTASNRFGLSEKGLSKQYAYTKKVEAGTGAAKKPLTDTFLTANRFIAAVRRFNRALIAPLYWWRVVMEVDGRKYTVCFLDALEAAQEELLLANPGDLRWWGEGPADDDGTASRTSSTSAAQPSFLRGVWDGQMLAEQTAHVQRTMRPGTAVLGLHLYSDATFSREVAQYPCTHCACASPTSTPVRRGG